MGKRHSYEDRHRLTMLVFDKGYTVKEASNIMDMKYRTAHSICTVFIKEMRTEAKKPPGRSKKFDEETRDEIVSWFEKNADGTLKGCQQHLQAVCPDRPVPSKSTIDRILKEKEYKRTRLSWPMRLATARQSKSIVEPTTEGLSQSGSSE